MKMLAQLVLWGTLSSCLFAYTASSFYWRDSAEFILSATYLDIAHPAGYPLYSQLANSFALLPLGPISWRVNAFSTFCGTLCLYLSFLLSRRILEQLLQLSTREASALAWISPMVLLGSAAFVRQSITSEVYILNADLFLLLILLFDKHLQTQDFRYLILCCFVAGLSLGNHVSLALAVVPALIWFFANFKSKKEALIPGLLAGCMGLCVYAYIPIRAATSPPLNTGGAYNFDRTWRLVSDARDRNLKATFAANSDTDTANKSDSDRISLLSEYARFLVKDVSKLAEETHRIFLLLAGIGLLLMVRFSPALALMIASVAASNWLFFHGWDPDPWIPQMALIGVCVSVALGRGIKLIGHQYRRLSFPVVGIVVFSCLIAVVSSSQEKLIFAKSLRDFDLPEQRARAILEDLPTSAPYITETSWFLLKGIRDLNGFRSDVTLVYQPRLLFPHYFESAILERVGDAQSLIFAPVDEVGSTSATSPLLENVGSFIKFAAPLGAVYVEPNVVLNAFLASVSQLDEKGRVVVRQNENKDAGIQFKSQRIQNLISLRQPTEAVAILILADSKQYLEAQLVNQADLLERLGHPEMSLELYQNVCLYPKLEECSGRSLVNLALFLLKSGREKEAIEFLHGVQQRYGIDPVVSRFVQEVMKRPYAL